MRLQELNKRRTREHIAQVALELFLTDGFDETTADAIANKAGVSRRTFFRYFPTKEAAFFANQQERLSRFETLLAAREDGESGYESVRRACLTLAGEYMEQREIALAQHLAVASSRNLIGHDQTLDAAWERAVLDTLIEGAADKDARFEALLQAAAIIGVIRTMLRQWFELGARDDLVEIGRRAFKVMESRPWGAR